MIQSLEISNDIYSFIDNVPLERDKIKELAEYIHYKAMLELFTIIIENSESNIEFLLPDYVEVINKLQIIVNNINSEYKNSQELKNNQEWIV